VCAYHPWIRWAGFNRVGDYSYGVYVYSFPIQQTVVQRLPGIEPLTLFGYAFPVVLAIAAVSWHALEKPALGLKSRFD
jgi:peptidoglycan/LPS O-acetylase OafA/YrhL